MALGKSFGISRGWPLAPGVVAATGNSAPVLVPVNSVAPVITGTPTVGQVLSVSSGTWSNSPTSYAYQWRRNGAVISGANASTYTLVSADGSASVSCDVTASNGNGAGLPASSNGVSVSPAAANTTFDSTSSRFDSSTLTFDKAA